MIKKIFLILTVLSILGCKENSKTEQIPVEPNNGIGAGAPPPKVLTFSENIEEAHNKTAFQMKEAVSFDIALEFGGKQRLNAKVIMATNSSKIRVEKEDGSTLIFDGENVALHPADASAKNARFDIFTWQYFFAMPFKLTDPGTVWGDHMERELAGSTYQTSRLSFKKETGDSPDDWYIVYKDPASNLLKAAVYIVTYSAEKADAEKNPHAIVYNNYTAIEHVSFAQTWDFYDWNEEDGLGKKLGEAKISNIEFFEPEESYFKISENSRVINKE